MQTHTRIFTTPLGNYSVQCESGDGDYTPQVILFVAQFVSGIGQPLYYTLGVSYMDDNILKSKTPTFISNERQKNLLHLFSVYTEHECTRHYTTAQNRDLSCTLFFFSIFFLTERNRI